MIKIDFETEMERFREIPMKSIHDLVVLDQGLRSTQEEEHEGGESKILIKRAPKDESELNATETHPAIETGGIERHESFLRNAIIKDEERRQMEEAYIRKGHHGFHGATNNAYNDAFVDNDREARRLKFRRFVEQTSELDDEIKGESLNEDDERDEDDSEEEDESEDEKDGTGNPSKKHKTFRIKPDPKYNGKYHNHSKCHYQF